MYKRQILLLLFLLFYTAYQFLPILKVVKQEFSWNTLKGETEEIGNNFYYLGSNSFHYLTLKNLGKIKEEFVLILIDAHSDLSPHTEKVNCGSWVNFALKLHRVKKVIWLGGSLGIKNEANNWINFFWIKKRKFFVFPAYSFRSYFKVKEKKIAKNFKDWKEGKNVRFDKLGNFFGFPGIYLYWFTYKEAIKEGILKELIDKDKIFISIDLDVLEEKEAYPTPWGNGLLSWKDLLQIVDYLQDNFEILGWDICGPEEGLRRFLKYEEKI